MPVSGLLITLSQEPEARDSALVDLRSRPELTVGEPSCCWLPVATETPDVKSGRDLHEWLEQLWGVEFVDVIYVCFDDSNDPFCPPDSGTPCELKRSENKTALQP